MRRSYIIILVVAGISAVIVSGVVAWRAVTVGFGNSYDFNGDARWMLRFLQRWQTDNVLAFHDVHPTRGWTPKARMSATNPPCHTNSRGQRGTTEYVRQPDKYAILAVGDSFTFGQQAADEDTWPHILESLDKRLQVINLGVCGYGADQMYITLRESVGEYKPALVLFAPIAEDLNRSLLSFREYRKPRFILDGEKRLQLTNVPIGDFNDTQAYLRAKFGRFFAKRGLDDLEKGFLRTIANGQYRQELLDLNNKIVQEADSCTRSAGANFLLVHLVTGAEPVDSVSILTTIAESNGFNYVSTKDAFAKANQPWSFAHYQRGEATVVAVTIFERIQQLPSWKAFAQR